jgi:hypothetical protein
MRASARWILLFGGDHKPPPALLLIGFGKLAQNLSLSLLFSNR